MFDLVIIVVIVGPEGDDEDYCHEGGGQKQKWEQMGVYVYNLNSVR